MHPLHTIWLSFFNLCRLRSGPQDLPTSSIFLALTLLFYTTISGVLSLMQFSVKDAILLTIGDTGLLVILTSSLLYTAHYPTRITQTLIAVAGTGCVFGILSLPWVFWIEFYEGDVSLPVLLLISIIVWNFVVYTHILHHALEIHFFLASILTVIIYLLTFSVLSQFVPLIN
ncbi:MAG: hypothetical protein DRQ57_05215 [Gammaproteobacteria bacterium]|nr:MAG: hypothetical protein DRQ57_05215 [Gammaproteobacteria bacterium]